MSFHAARALSVTQQNVIDPAKGPQSGSAAPPRHKSFCARPACPLEPCVMGTRGVADAPVRSLWIRQTPARHAHAAAQRPASHIAPAAKVKLTAKRTDAFASVLISFSQNIPVARMSAFQDSPNLRDQALPFHGTRYFSAQRISISMPKPMIPIKIMPIKTMSVS